MKKIYTLLFVIAFCLNKSNSYAQVNVQDSLALVDLYNNTDGPHWGHKEYWLTSKPIELWYGVVVRNERVAELHFNNVIQSYKLYPIPVSFGNLSALTFLDFSADKFSSGFSVIGSLTNLTYLNLSACNLDSFPASFGNLTKLEYLYLSNNNTHYANIPSSFSNLKNLQRLNLYYTTPDETTLYAWLANLSELEYLNFGLNSFTDTIPQSFENLSKLKYLNFAFNDYPFTTVPKAFTALISLDTLDLTKNNFDKIPGSFANLNNLKYLDLSQNKFKVLPAVLGSLSSLEFLKISFNSHYVSLPVELGNLVKLKRLLLSSTKLKGPIPESFGNLKNLKELYLNENYLSGTIPSSLGNLKKLTKLYLGNNLLDGAIPASLGNLSKLKILQLNNNLLNDSIPSSLGQLPNLITLNLSNNQLSGRIPSMLDSFKQTNFSIYLDSNMLTFAGMEGLVKANYSITIYSPQASVPLHLNGNVLSVSAGGTLIHNKYRWYKNGALFSTKTGDSTLTISTSGFYYVVITNSVAVDLKLISKVVAYPGFAAEIVNTNFSNKILAYPNPANKFINLSLENAAPENTYCIICNAEGKIVMQQRISEGSPGAEYPVSNIANGNYQLVIMQNEKILYRKKIVILH